MKESLLKIEHLEKVYSNAVPLADVNLTVSEGEVISIIGPSGTGKSTLLRMINRLEEPTAGKIYLRGEEITAPGCDMSKVRQRIGMIFQSFNLFPHLTVVENIMAAPLALKKMPRQEAYDKAKELLGSVGLSAKAFNYPEELSGGQQQRVAIVRALAMEPEILLLDEPTSALDPTMTGEVEAVIRKVAASGATMMMVTHSMELAQRVSSRILYIDEGGIYEEGTPEEIFAHPQKERTRQFLGRLKVLEINIDSQNFDFYGCNDSIASFCRKNDVPQGMTYSLMLLFEEICSQILPKQIQAPVIKWVAEYSDDKGQVTVRLDYNGEPFDFRNSENGLSLGLVRSMAEITAYEFREGESLGNKVLLKVKKR
jgi:polar amino acid transport system ATP-binding protein